jgi:hypothetical protein
MYAPSTVLPPHLSPFIGDIEANKSLIINNEQNNKNETKIKENGEKGFLIFFLIKKYFLN